MPCPTVPAQGVRAESVAMISRRGAETQRTALITPQTLRPSGDEARFIGRCPVARRLHRRASHNTNLPAPAQGRDAIHAIRTWGQVRTDLSPAPSPTCRTESAPVGARHAVPDGPAHGVRAESVAMISRRGAETQRTALITPQTLRPSGDEARFIGRCPVARQIHPRASHNTNLPAPAQGRDAIHAIRTWTSRQVPTRLVRRLAQSGTARASWETVLSKTQQMPPILSDTPLQICGSFLLEAKNGII